MSSTNTTRVGQQLADPPPPKLRLRKKGVIPRPDEKVGHPAENPSTTRKPATLPKTYQQPTSSTQVVGQPTHESSIRNFCRHESYLLRSNAVSVSTGNHHRRGTEPHPSFDGLFTKTEYSRSDPSRSLFPRIAPSGWWA